MKSYARTSPLRLHTPGHKGELCNLDITELTDGSFPLPQIAAAERDIAKAFGTEHARMLECGSSQGIKAAIMYANRSAVIDCNSHRAVYDGFKLSGKSVVAAGVKNRITPLTVDEIESALTPEIGAVVITSPTYFGYCADVEAIGAFCKQRGLMFIIDGAHGAHFGASTLLPQTFAEHCDICNVSAHKTLNALTQGAILLDNLDAAGHGELEEKVRLLGTTSPSYLIYASIESAVKTAREKESENAYAELFGAVNDIKTRLPFLHNDDFTRLVFDCEKANVTPDKLNAALCAAGCYAELVSDKYIVFLLTASDTSQTVEQLERAIDDALRKINNG